MIANTSGLAAEGTVISVAQTFSVTSSVGRKELKTDRLYHRSLAGMIRFARARVPNAIVAAPPNFGSDYSTI
jgi:hypothetical protein